MYKQVPTYSGQWSTTSFSTREEFRDFLIPLFKEPGKYQFDETSYKFNEQARLYNQNKAYCFAPLGTKDYITYWDDQKDKCRNGVIFKSGDLTWYLPREYYMWLNFLPIFNKEIQAYGFADVRDAQYHLALYEILAELHNKHVALLKKRQIASSYYHCAKLINQLWFEEGVTLKIGASQSNYVSDTWKFLNEYKSFLNEHTAWYRPMTPDKVLLWQQQIEVTKGNRKSMKGLKGSLKGLTFEKDPVRGVGGPCRYFFMEEAGIQPTMNTTIQYLYPAMRSGYVYTGQFIAAGSVGDLEQCEPLKKMILSPHSAEIYPVETNLIDEKGTIAQAGLFIPEQWSMPPYIDQYGNSMVEEALKALDEEFANDRKILSPPDFQLKKSQHPRNIAEAFAWRKESVFPLHLVNAQLKRIEEKEYPYELIDLSRDATGNIKVSISNKLPISEWPISTAIEDKEGCIVVWERPILNPIFGPRGSYFFSIDPVGEGRTTTGDSLCSIQILKNPVEVTRVESGQVTTYIERDKIVASWCGRFNDIEKTHERLELLIEWYNAWGPIENNVSLFIQYMKFKKKQRFLAPKDQMLFLKEAQANQNVHQDFGWRNTGDLFKRHLLSYGIEYLSEELDHVTKEDGTIVRTTYGVERIPDPMLLKEMAGYQEGVNCDRLVSYCALIAFSKLQQANAGYLKRVIEVDKDHKKEKNPYLISKSAFTHMGMRSDRSMSRPVRNPFKNLH